LKTSTRKAGIAASILAGALALTACSSAATWQDEVRADSKAHQAAMPAAELQEECAALELFGIDTPEALTDMVVAMGGETDDTMWEDTGVDPADIPEGSKKEAIQIVSEENFASCEGVESASSSPTPEPQPTLDQSDGTAVVGEAFTVDDWTVTVTSVKEVSDAQVQSWNPYNEDAAGQYVSVEWTATYNGTDRNADAFMDLFFYFNGTDGTVYEESFIVNEYDADGASTTVQPGGTAKYAATFDVPTGAIDGGTVTVEDLMGDDWTDVAW